MIGLTGFSSTDQSQNSKDAFVVDKTNKKAVVDPLKVDVINVVSDVGKTYKELNKVYITDKYKGSITYMLSFNNIKNYSKFKETKTFKGNIYRRARDGLTRS